MFDLPFIRALPGSQQSRELEFPKGKKQTPITQLVRFVAVIRHGQQYLLKKKKGKGGDYEDLYEFPFVEYQEGKPAKQIFEAHFGITLREIAPLLKSGIALP